MFYENTLKAVGDFQLLEHDTISYFLHETCGVSELQRLPSEYTALGHCYAFTIYFSHGVQVEFGYETEKEGRAARKNYIVQLSNYFGPDQLIYVNGLDMEIAVLHAVVDMTDVFVKDNRASFSVSVKSMPFPVNLIFMDELAARSANKELADAIESLRRNKRPELQLRTCCG